MLRAYLDSSSNDANDVVAVGGVLAQDEQWAGFIPAWQRMLDTYRLRQFHAAEYWSRKGQFARMKEADHIALRRNVCRIFKLFKPLAVATIVGGAAFQEWRPGQEAYQYPDGQYLALNHTLNGFLMRIDTQPVDEGLVIYADKDTGHEKLMNEITEWQISRVRTMIGLSPDRLNRQRAVAVQFGPSSDVIPLQAANLIAHSALRWGHDRLKGVNTEEPFLAGIKPECSVTLNSLVTKEYIDREQRLLEKSSFV